MAGKYLSHIASTISVKEYNPVVCACPSHCVVIH